MLQYLVHLLSFSPLKQCHLKSLVKKWCILLFLILTSITVSGRNSLFCPKSLQQDRCLQNSWIEALQFNSGMCNNFCIVLLNCLCHISSPVNSLMHTKAKVSKNSPKQAVLEGAAEEKVCQTDKCSGHSDNKHCYGQTVLLTISRTPTSSVFISMKWHQIINLLSFPLFHSPYGCSARTMHTFHIFVGGIEWRSHCLMLFPI